MKNAPFHELEQEQKKNRNYGARKGHWQTCLVIVLLFHLFSRDEATLYKGVSVRPLVGRSVSPSATLLLFGPQGATYGRVSGLVSIVSYEMALRDFGSMGKK